jgi:hypothetical protein
MKYFIIVVTCILLFSNCFDNSKSKEASKDIVEKDYRAQGQEIAAKTFTALSTNLQKAMQEGGVAKAVKYCNLAASPIVDSLQIVYNANIKRTSLKIRNPNNRPTDNERKQLQEFQDQLKKGEALSSKVVKKDNLINFYAPIQFMTMCGKCHGKVGKELKKEDYDIIQELYPLDKAINYQNGDLRGMWSITFYEK